MCGRFVSTAAPQTIADVFGAVVDPLLAESEARPNWNVAPTTNVLAVGATSVGRTVRAYRWGLVPSWTKELRRAPSLINARAETIAEKPSFRSSFRRHRLLLPMDGFYEWQQITGAAGSVEKRPIYAHAADGHLLAAAGIWSAWHDPAAPDDVGWLHSCAVVTTTANPTMQPVHDRMPVFIAEADWDVWLDPSCDDVRLLGSLLVPAPEGLLVLDEVSSAVNNVRNRGPELIRPV